MISDLDKYGLVALTIVVVLILFIAMNDLQEDESFDPTGIYFDEPDPAPAVPARSDTVVFVEEVEPAPPVAQERSDFDFGEGPVDYPGSRPRTVPVVADHQGGRHRVLKGETLSAISYRYYGTANRWKSIADANPKVNSKNLPVGYELVIPQSAGTGDTAVKEERRSETLREYRVKRGDTLGKIAKNFYGSTTRWKKIYNANQNVIKNPKSLKIGAVIKIPN